MNALKITIPKPCTVSSSIMADAAFGKYCPSCQKEVIDFSQMPNNELYYFFKNTKEIPCGSFLPSQLNTIIKPTSETHYYVKKKTHIAAALLLLLMLQASPSVALPLQPIRTEISIKKPMPNTDGNNLMTITGHVVDDHGHNMKNVEVTFGDFAKTKTDSLGKFSFEYNIATGNGFLIGFAFEGFNSFARNYNSAMGSTHYEVELVKRGREIGRYHGGAPQPDFDASFVTPVSLQFSEKVIKLNDDLKAQLDELASQLKQANIAKVIINSGVVNSPISRSIANKRNKAIVSYLVNSKGIAKSRFYLSYSEKIEVNEVEITAE